MPSQDEATYDVPRPLVAIQEEDYYMSPKADPVPVNSRPASSSSSEGVVEVIKMTNCIARALYDNDAESPDELAFRRNDLLTVLEQNTAGLEGWWLCSLRGRQGICPGNRLRILPGVYDTGSGVTSLSGLVPRPGATSPGPRTQRPTSNKVVTPRRVGDVYTYDTPRALTQASHLDYDVPPSKHSTIDTSGSRLSRSSSLRYDAPRSHVRSSLDQYDIPRSQYDSPKNRPLYDSPKAQQHYDSPRPHPEGQRMGGGVVRSMIKGIRGGMPATVTPGDNLQEYDVPRPTNTNQEVQHDMPPSDRSSGVSVMSCESSQLSTSSSASSLAPSESLSLSSYGGSSNRSSLESHDVYDIPPEPRKVGSQRPKLPPREGKDLKDAYDVPRNVLAAGSEMYDTPPSRMPRSLVIRGTGGEGVYDVPPQVSRDVRQQDCVDSAPNRLSSGSDSSGGEIDLSYGKDLPLEYDSALETLVKLQQEVYSAIEKLSLVHKNASWRAKDTMEEREEELKNLVSRLLQSVTAISEFGQGSVINASQNGERGIARRLQRLIEPVNKIASIIEESLTRIRKGAWRAALTCGTNPENFNQLATIAHSLVDDVHLLANTIQNKGMFIFKKSPALDTSGYTRQQGIDDEEKTPVQERPLPDLPNKKPFENLYENDTKNWLEDYDYVNLETRATVEREHEDIKKELPADLRKSFDNLVKQSQLIVDSDHEKVIQKSDQTQISVQKRGGNNTLDPNDKQVINFYGSQSEVHLKHLNTAIDAFLLTIENNQPPKVFIAHSKFVILNAHKLVYIGDTVHRTVVNPEVRTRVLNCSNALSDQMKHTVTAAKTAALQFPSVTAVQAMVDSFVAVSHLANNLKQAISVTPI
ncbi:breast cancer anti-estrogen resistance protein 1-like isoform X2 [Portunus trituberculatus]|uniref:breast cancer anti-estrogen resistance protein 1-like isoform X2 n=1 Tax=Portunus trituberculatus TaxID=210409 RepID=UPI001E1CD4F9|nr:breast cancer anti-estrogen resistance protein 1-like isoform X2 [Portunus trituberculatus]